VALRSVADDGDLHALDDGEVGVLVVVNVHCCFP
jgi:hypothetical protein